LIKYSSAEQKIRLRFAVGNTVILLITFLEALPIWESEFLGRLS
jgi:hypothetical protein